MCLCEKCGRNCPRSWIGSSAPCLQRIQTGATNRRKKFYEELESFLGLGEKIPATESILCVFGGRSPGGTGDSGHPSRVKAQSQSAFGNPLLRGVVAVVLASLVFLGRL